MNHSLKSLIKDFPNRRVLVVGDIILDHYVRGSVSRTSPEAPVPILAVEEEDWLPGGAANVASNLVALGARVELLGLVGTDEAGQKLREIFSQIDNLRPHLLGEKNRPTILKTRCVSQGQQMLRLDRETILPADRPVLEKALAVARKQLDRCDGLILSDYGKGFLHPDFLQAIIAEAKARGKKVLVDPKGRDYARYRGATMLTPNQKEASEATGVPITTDEDVLAAAKVLQRTIHGEAVVITRGAGGVSVFPRRGKPSHIPARALEVFDVTGAGDTFLSVLGLALFSGATWKDAAMLGNLGAGIVVGHVGVATVSPEELLAATDSQTNNPRRKIVGRDALIQQCRSRRHHEEKIVFTNGFFDLLHNGHIRLLEEARAMGDCLVVALNSDESTRRLKGPPRPILREKERCEMLSALPFVDYVIVFEEDTPEPLLKRLRPDVLVKGSPNGASSKAVVGREIVESYGGKVRVVKTEEGLSITDLLARMSTPGKK